MSSLSIGQLAKHAGVGVDTVRYYERDGLLSPAGRLASGYRRYGVTELKRLRFIRRAKALGFSLDDIRSLLTLSEQQSVAEVKRAAQTKLTRHRATHQRTRAHPFRPAHADCRLPRPRSCRRVPDSQCAHP